MEILKAAIKNIALAVMAIGIGMGTVVAWRWVTTPGQVKISGDYSRIVADVGHGRPVMVVLKGCPHCEDARVWLGRHKVAFQEVEIGTNQSVQVLLKQHDINSTPTLITRRLLTVGFYPQIWATEFGIEK